MRAGFSFDLSEYKKIYKSIGDIKCPYFNDEEVIFNKKGFNHLIRTGKNQRYIFDQRRRLNLLKYCFPILNGDYVNVEYRKISKGKVIHFWTFTSYINGRYIKLIVRQIAKGRKQFLSIFPVKH